MVPQLPFLQHLCRVALLARWQSVGEAIKERLKTNTQRAVDRGTFGIPTMFVGDRGEPGEMFFGKERLGQIEELLSS